MKLVGMELKPVGDTNYVKMVLKSASDWSNEEKARQFAGILASEGGFLLPEKFDRREPERFIFDAGDLSKFVEIWTSGTGGPITNRKKPWHAWTMVEMCYRESRRFNEFISGFDERYFKQKDNIARLLSCAKRLYNWGAITHGYLCHAKDWESKNRYGRILTDARGRPSAGGGTNLKEELPGIYWANLFGPVYVQFFGGEKFRSVPAYHKEELPDGGFMLLTSASPFDYGQTKIRKLEEKIIDHLGREAFFEKAHPKKVCRVPQFTFEQKALGRPIEIIEYDPVSEVISDPKHFIRESAQLAEKFIEGFTDKFDYSPRSLDKVDDFILKKSYRRSEPWKKKRWCQLIKELTAYYGEVLRRNLRGKWIVKEISEGINHPAIVFNIQGQCHDEFPFTRVTKLWCEWVRADGLAIRYHLFQSGE